MKIKFTAFGGSEKCTGHFHLPDAIMKLEIKKSFAMGDKISLGGIEWQIVDYYIADHLDGRWCYELCSSEIDNRSDAFEKYLRIVCYIMTNVFKLDWSVIEREDDGITANPFISRIWFEAARAK